MTHNVIFKQNKYKAYITTHTQWTTDGDSI